MGVQKVRLIQEQLQYFHVFMMSIAVQQKTSETGKIKEKLLVRDLISFYFVKASCYCSSKVVNET